MRLALGIFPNLEKNSVRNILRHVVDFCQNNNIEPIFAIRYC